MQLIIAAIHRRQIDLLGNVQYQLSGFGIADLAPATHLRPGTRWRPGSRVRGVVAEER
jgi:hypothetical protein